MTVSKKKTAAKKQAPASRKQVPAPAKQTPPRQGKAVKAAAKKTPPARKEPGGAERLERELAKARLEIRRLEEDRNHQVALAEAAELERSMMFEQLQEAEEKLHALERRQSERAMQPPAEIHQIEVDEEEVGFEDEEQEPEADDLDDVEAIYSRMDDPRVRRQELDRERLDRESEAGDEPYWMVCPKCGDTLEEVDAEDLKLDRCEACGGIYLDHGEVEMLLMLARGPDGLRRVTSALRV
jgi:hypothetical protein